MPRSPEAAPSPLTRRHRPICCRQHRATLPAAARLLRGSPARSTPCPTGPRREASGLASGAANTRSPTRSRRLMSAHVAGALATHRSRERLGFGAKTVAVSSLERIDARRHRLRRAPAVARGGHDLWQRRRTIAASANIGASLTRRARDTFALVEKGDDIRKPIVHAGEPRAEAARSGALATLRANSAIGPIASGLCAALVLEYCGERCLVRLEPV